MSLRRPVLNFYLRWFEKRRLAKTADVADIRKYFDRGTRLFFHGPRGTTKRKLNLDGGIAALEILPRKLRSDLVIFYIHGGGFLFGQPENYAAMMGGLAARLGSRIVMPRYRLAPEYPCPCAIDDVTEGYRALIRSGVSPDRIVIGGDSAGGTLAFNLLARITAEEWPRPRGVFAFSPFTDFAFEGASFRENAAQDAILPAQRAHEMLDMYLAGADPQDPAINPLRADYHGAPPVWICVSDTEILRDDARRLHERLTKMAVPCHLEEAYHLPHVWPIFHNFLPEARETLDSVAVWIRTLRPRASES